MYEKLPEDQRAKLLKMDADAEAAKAKLRADIMTDPAVKAGVLYLLKWAKSWYMAIGYKRIGEILVSLAKELL